MAEACVDVGTVVSVKDGMAKVKMIRTHDCGGCKACLFAGKGDIVIPARNTVEAKEGDQVRVDLNKSSVHSLLAVLIALGIPLLLMIGAVVGCSLWGLKDWITFVVAIAVLVVGFGVTVFTDRLLRKSRLAAAIVEILQEETKQES